MVRTAVSGRVLATGLVLSLFTFSSSFAQSDAIPTPTPSASPTATSTPDDALLREVSRELGAQATPTPAPGVPARPASATLSNAFNPAISLSGLFAGAAFSETEMPEPGGHDPAGSGVTLQNLELTLSANVDPFLRADAHVIFGLDSIEVEEAYFTTTALPASLELRGGQFFTRFGRQNPQHPHAWWFADQNLPNTLILGHDGLRNPGLSGSWLAPLPIFVEVIGSVQDPRGETASPFLGEVEEGEEPARVIDSPAELLYSSRLTVFVPIGEDLSVSLGASGATGPNPSTPTARTQLAGGDLYVKWKPSTSITGRFLFLQAEGMGRRYDVGGGEAHEDRGATVALGGRFARRWESAIRAESTHSERIGIDPEEPRWRSRLAAQLTFRPSEFSKFRVQGSHDAIDGFDDPVLGAMFQFEFLIGAHAAHQF